MRLATDQKLKNPWLELADSCDRLDSELTNAVYFKLSGRPRGASGHMSGVASGFGLMSLVHVVTCPVTMPLKLGAVVCRRLGR